MISVKEMSSERNNRKKKNANLSTIRTLPIIISVLW